MHKDESHPCSHCLLELPPSYGVVGNYASEAQKTLCFRQNGLKMNALLDIYYVCGLPIAEGLSRTEGGA